MTAPPPSSTTMPATATPSSLAQQQDDQRRVGFAEEEETLTLSATEEDSYFDEEEEPWDEASSKQSAHLPPKTTTSTFLSCVDELFPTDVEDAPLEDGELPALTIRPSARQEDASKAGRWVNGKRTSMRPIAPPSMNGMQEAEKRQEFWSQLDPSESELSPVGKGPSVPMDYDDTEPDDERSARELEEERKEVFEKPTYLDTTYEEDENADFCSSFLAQMCGTPKDAMDPSIEDTDQKRAAYVSVAKMKTPTSVEEQTAIEVEYVDPKLLLASSGTDEETLADDDTAPMTPPRGGSGSGASSPDRKPSPGKRSSPTRKLFKRGSSKSSTKSAENSLLETPPRRRSNGVEDDSSIPREIGGDDPNAWSPSKKNAYLAAMARQAKEDFEKKKRDSPERKRSSSSASTTSVDQDQELYKTFTTAEKRKFLKLINNGMTPAEAAAQIEDEQLNDATTNRRGVGGGGGPLAPTTLSPTGGDGGSGGKKRFSFFKLGNSMKKMTPERRRKNEPPTPEEVEPLRGEDPPSSNDISLASDDEEFYDDDVRHIIPIMADPPASNELNRNATATPNSKRNTIGIAAGAVAASAAVGGAAIYAASQQDARDASPQRRRRRSSSKSAVDENSRSSPQRRRIREDDGSSPTRRRRSSKTFEEDPTGSRRRSQSASAANASPSGRSPERDSLPRRRSKSEMNEFPRLSSRMSSSELDSSQSSRTKVRELQGGSRSTVAPSTDKSTTKKVKAAAKTEAVPASTKSSKAIAVKSSPGRKNKLKIPSLSPKNRTKKSSKASKSSPGRSRNAASQQPPASPRRTKSSASTAPKQSHKVPNQSRSVAREPALPPEITRSDSEETDNVFAGGPTVAAVAAGATLAAGAGVAAASTDMFNSTPSDEEAERTDDELFSRSGSNFYDAVRKRVPGGDEGDAAPNIVLSPSNRSSSGRDSQRRGFFPSRGPGFSSLDGEGSDRSRRRRMQEALSPPSEHGARRRLLGIPLPGKKQSSRFSALQDDGRFVPPSDEMQPESKTRKSSKAAPIAAAAVAAGAAVAGGAVASRGAPLKESEEEETESEVALEKALLAPPKIQTVASEDSDGIDLEEDDQVERPQGSDAGAPDDNAIEQLERNLLRPITAPEEANNSGRSTHSSRGDEEEKKDDDSASLAEALPPGRNRKTDAARAAAFGLEEGGSQPMDDEVSLDRFIEATTSVHLSGVNQDSSSVVSGKSHWTAATGGSNITQSSRKRHHGAARSRLAKAKAAERKVTKRTGWRDSIQAAAQQSNSRWDPAEGWVEYAGAPTIDEEQLLDAGDTVEKLRINLDGVVVSPKNNEKDRERQIETSEGTPVDVPFPTEWEEERKEMIGQDKKEEDEKEIPLIKLKPVVRSIVSPVQEEVYEDMMVSPSDQLEGPTNSLDGEDPEVDAILSDPIEQTESKDDSLDLYHAPKEARELSPPQVAMSNAAVLGVAAVMAVPVVANEVSKRGSPTEESSKKDEESEGQEVTKGAAHPETNQQRRAPERANAEIFDREAIARALPSEMQPDEAEERQAESKEMKAQEVSGPAEPKRQEPNTNEHSEAEFFDEEAIARVIRDAEPTLGSYKKRVSARERRRPVSEERRQATSGSSEKIESPSRPVGWLDTMKAAVANLQGSEAKWDPDSGWQGVGFDSENGEGSTGTWDQQSLPATEDESEEREISEEMHGRDVADGTMFAGVALAGAAIAGGAILVNSSGGNDNKETSPQRTTAQKELDLAAEELGLPPSSSSDDVFQEESERDVHPPMVKRLPPRPESISPFAAFGDQEREMDHSLNEESTAATPAPEKYMQLGENGSVKSYPHDQTPANKGQSSMGGAHQMRSRTPEAHQLAVGPRSFDEMSPVLSAYTSEELEMSTRSNTMAQGEPEDNHEEKAPSVQVVKEKVEDDDLNLFATFTGPTSHDAASPSRRRGRGRGPIDVDEVDNLTSSSEDDSQMENDSFLGGRVPTSAFPSMRLSSGSLPSHEDDALFHESTMPAPVAPKRRLPPSTPPRLKGSMKDTSPIRSKPVEPEPTPVRSAKVVEPEPVSTSFVIGDLEKTNAQRPPTPQQSQPRSSPQSGPQSIHRPGSNEKKQFSRTHPGIKKSPSQETDTSAASSSVRLRAQQWEKILSSPTAGPAVNVPRRSQEASAPQQRQPQQQAESRVSKKPPPKFGGDGKPSPSNSTNEWKSFLSKKVKAESAAAAASKERSIGEETASITKEALDRHNRSRQEDEDTIFDFKSDHQSEGRFGHLRGVPRQQLPVAHPRTPGGQLADDFDGMSPIDMGDSGRDDAKESSGVLSESDGSNLMERASDTGTAIEQATFFNRLKACAAPIMGTGESAGGVPSSHLAFLRNSPAVVNANKTGTAPASQRYAPPALCGRPDTIVEDDEDSTTVGGSVRGDSVQGGGSVQGGNPVSEESQKVVSPSATVPATVAPKKRYKSSALSVGSEMPSSSSVVSGNEFGGKTSFLESMAMKAAVSDPKRSRSRSRSRGRSGGRSTMSDISSSSSSRRVTERWQEFLERKSASGSGSKSTGDVSKDPEEYAARKVNEMMKVMAEQRAAAAVPQAQGRMKNAEVKKSGKVDEMIKSFSPNMERETQQRPPPASSELNRRSDGTRAFGGRARKSDSAKIAEELAAARVEQMMAQMTSRHLDEGEI